MMADRQFLRLFLLPGLFALAASAAWARPGIVEFSDGKSVAGNITLTPGKQIQVLAGEQQRAFGLEQVREMRFAPAEEAMERKWRFIEAGKPMKEFTGQPFPVRHVRATMTLSDGSTFQGHLLTTVLYVEAKEGTQKVILYAKQRGEEGQTLAQLVYPTLVRFTDEAAKSAAELKLVMKVPDGSEVVGATIGSTVVLPVKAAGNPGEFALTAPLGEDFLLGYRQGNEIVVGWPKGADEKVVARVREGVGDAEDFFDGKQLLGAFHDAAAGNVYSLMLLSRQRHTTMGGAKTQPWRVSVWRWKYEPESNQLMLAGRCDMFRDIIGRGGALPKVTTDEKLWKPKVDGKSVVIQ